MATELQLNHSYEVDESSDDETWAKIGKAYNKEADLRQQLYWKEYYERNRERLNAYTTENRWKYVESIRDWKKTHAEEIKEHNKELILCEPCKCYITRNGMSQHRRSKKHSKNIKA